MDERRREMTDGRTGGAAKKKRVMQLLQIMARRCRMPSASSALSMRIGGSECSRRERSAAAAQDLESGGASGRQEIGQVARRSVTP